MKEENKVEIISSETVDVVINSIKQAKEEHPELKSIDTEKVKEVIESLRGCTVRTAISVISTAFLLLPAGGIMSCLDMGKSALKVKTAVDLRELMGECFKCSEEDAAEVTEASEAPTE